MSPFLSWHSFSLWRDVSRWAPEGVPVGHLPVNTTSQVGTADTPSSLSGAPQQLRANKAVWLLHPPPGNTRVCCYSHVRQTILQLITETLPVRQCCCCQCILFCLVLIVDIFLLFMVNVANESYKQKTVWIFFPPKMSCVCIVSCLAAWFDGHHPNFQSLLCILHRSWIYVYICSFRQNWSLSPVESYFAEIICKVNVFKHACLLLYSLPSFC